ncbi:myb-like protein P isoform X1 [Episyrphus balteatus]|uniref:myb-like protein P isoform X1 n=1 Tax=Episyrphus balteatus TaxID=286459 RepID=UPI0024854395|nr:myb-like protein P isoform X1 [Episyrphus balteatus]
MVLAERNSDIVRNGRRSRGPSPNGNVVGASGTPETSSDDDNSIKRNGKAKTKQSEYEEKIRVGRDYQAVCPPLVPEPERKPEVLNDRALLVWSPTKEIPDPKLEEYISVAKEKYGYNGEQALGMLFWHKHDLERAVMDLANFTPFPDEWTVEDKVLFEQAFQFHGKSFHRIRQMLPDKSIASLVKYYYSWKKTRHRQSVMDRQEKAKASKEGSENGSDNGSNEESDNEEKDQALASSSGLQDSKLCSSSGAVGGGLSVGSGNVVGLVGDNKNNKQSSNITAMPLNSPTTSGTAVVHVTNTAAASNTQRSLTPTSTTPAASPSATKRQQNQQQQTPNSNLTNSSSNEVTTSNQSTNANCANSSSITTAGGCCSGCGVACNMLNDTPHGKLCNSCHHHWRRTGNKRPTAGPYFGKRYRDRNADRHKRKPPRGMHINHDDIVALASSSNNQDQLLANTEREIVSLLSQVQLNKQNISSIKRKNSESLEELRPNESSNRINSRWTNEELLLAVSGVRKYGKDYQTIADTLGTKTDAHVRTFYVNYRRRYNLDQVLKEHEAEKDLQLREEQKKKELQNVEKSSSINNDDSNSNKSLDTQGCTQKDITINEIDLENETTDQPPAKRLATALQQDSTKVV